MKLTLPSEEGSGGSTRPVAVPSLPDSGPAGWPASRRHLGPPRDPVHPLGLWGPGHNTHMSGNTGRAQCDQSWPPAPSRFRAGPAEGWLWTGTRVARLPVLQSRSTMGGAQASGHSCTHVQWKPPWCPPHIPPDKWKPKSPCGPGRARPLIYWGPGVL